MPVQQILEKFSNDQAIPVFQVCNNSSPAVALQRPPLAKQVWAYYELYCKSPLKIDRLEVKTIYR